MVDPFIWNSDLDLRQLRGRWAGVALGGAGLLLGMGVAMVLATLVVRRRGAPTSA